MNILIDVDDRLVRELERVAPARSRKRSEFVRMAIRKALMDEAERRTREAYLRQRDEAPEALDVDAWDTPPKRRAAARKRRKR